MNSRLEANVLRGWKPGWRAGIADNIATTSAVQTRRNRIRNRRAWKAVIRITLTLAAIGLLIALNH